MTADHPPSELSDSRYRLAELLGQGGSATVWRAWDERLQAERAVKVLAQEKLGDDATQARFLAEARAMATLVHPNVLRIFDIGQDGPWVFMVMELAPGGTLWGWVRRHGPMPPRLAVELLLPVAGALEATHHAGIIHRDVKPQNIMLDAQGQPRLADFGIARVRHGDEHELTRTGSSLGTWGYMAPEQRKDARSVDARADVYALGATLWALLTGEVPVDLFAWGVPADLESHLPPALLALVRRATHFEPDQRFANMEELAAALTTLLPILPPLPADTPRTGPPPDTQHDGFAPTRTAASRPSSTRRRLGLPLAGSVLVTLALGCLAWWGWAQREAPAEPESSPPAGQAVQPSPPRPEPSPPPAPAPEPAGAQPVEPPPSSPASTLTTPAPGAGRQQPPPSTPAAALPPTTGEIAILGDVFSAVLIDSQGERHTPGALAPGRYSLEVALTNGTTITREDLVVLEAGEHLEVQCLVAVENCRVVRR